MSQIRIIPLGGVREFGLNSMVIETSSGAVLIDAGLMFPRYNITGIDQLVPDFSYVIQNQEKFQGILLTHGHEDHIGALTYLLKDAPIPVYGHPFTLDLVRRKLREYELDHTVQFIDMHDRDVITLAGMEIEAVEVMHSTLGCFAFSLQTAQGRIVHSGDFRHAPARYDEYESTRLFMCECTNAEIDPPMRDEELALKNIEAIVKDTPGGVIVSTFSSHVQRIKALYDIAVASGRRMAIMGRSMKEVLEIAQDQEYIEMNPACLIDADMVANTDRSKLMIVCTGAQGEIYSALSLISRGWHKYKVREGDSIIISARMIPGNEFSVGRCIDQLLDFGAQVYYSGNAAVHSTGHATHADINDALNYLQPEIVMPIHGEFRFMKALAAMAAKRGLDSVVLSRPGQIWTLDEDGMQLTGEITHGKCFIDGELSGDIRDIVLRDRRHISEGGLVVAFAVIDSETKNIAVGPDVMAKGVVPAPVELELLDALRQRAYETLYAQLHGDQSLQAMQSSLKDELGRYLKSRLGKKPMVIPIVMEI